MLMNAALFGLGVVVGLCLAGVQLVQAINHALQVNPYGL